MEKSVPVYFPDASEPDGVLLIGAAKVKYDGKIVITLHNTELGDAFRSIVTTPEIAGFTVGYLTAREK